MHAEARVTEEGVVGAGVGEADHVALVTEQLRHLVLFHVEQLGREGGVQILVQAEVEEGVHRVLSLLGRDIGDGATLQAGILRARGDGHFHPIPVPVEDAAAVGSPFASVRQSANGGNLGFFIRLRPAVDGEHWIGGGELEIHAQRLARCLGVDRMAAGTCCGALTGDVEGALGLVGVVKQRRVHHRPAADAGQLLHRRLRVVKGPGRRSSRSDC